MAELVIALDYTDALDALNMASSLRHTVKWMKVGLELFTREGPRVVQTLKGMGFHVMLDLKLHDIPNTVQGGVRSAAWIGADILTLHLMGGERMCRAAVEELEHHEHKPLLLGVTVLTSTEQGELPGVTMDVRQLAHDLAGCADVWGLGGVVCSGLEVADIKQAHPRLKCLTPGIRPTGANAQDQRRVVTPAEAVKLGSDFLVVGRPVTHAADPKAAAEAIVRDMQTK